MRLLGLPPPVVDARQVRLLDEVVVLQVADEDAGQHPGDRDLLQVIVTPDLERLRRAAPRDDRPVGGPQAIADLGDGFGPLPQVGLDLLRQSLQVVEEGRRVEDNRGHDVIVAAARCAFSSQASGTRARWPEARRGTSHPSIKGSSLCSSPATRTQSPGQVSRRPTRSRSRSSRPT